MFIFQKHFHLRGETFDSELVVVQCSPRRERAGLPLSLHYRDDRGRSRPEGKRRLVQAVPEADG